MKTLKFNAAVSVLEDSIIEVNGKKYYRVLEPGVIYSNNKGQFDITPQLLSDIVKNFESGANETQPFVDVEHDQSESCGPITAVMLHEGMLYIHPEWNDKGRHLVGEKRYMYLSVDVEPVKNSKTGAVTYPVLVGSGLTNKPVYKGQKIMKLSELPTGDKSEKIKGDKTMDELKKAWEALKGLIATLMKGEEADAVKAEVGNIAAEIGDISGAGETVAMSDHTKQVEKLTGEINGLEKQLSDKKLTGNEQVEALTIRLNELKDSFDKTQEILNSQDIQLKRYQFNEKYGKKLVPGNRDKFFTLFLKDEKAVDEIIKEMPEHKLTDSIGSSSDVKSGALKLSEVEVLVSTETKKTMSEKKCSYEDALVIVLSEHKDWSEIINK